MADAAHEQASHGEEDHRLGDVETALVIAHQASVAHEPAEGTFNNPAARDHLEAWLGIQPPDDLDHEVEESGLVEQLAPVVGAVGEEVLHPGPALADRFQDLLRASA